MTTTLPLFWHLSSSSKKDRLDASVKLVGALEQFQAKFTPTAAATTKNKTADASDSEDEETGAGAASSSKPDGLDVLNSQDVTYSIRRLIRGLASPRESSRLGFAVALTELLSRIDTVTCDQILSIIASSSKPEGSMTGQEERDMLFARLFGFMSVIRSGLLVRTTPLATSASSKTEASSLASCKEVIEQLVACGEKKSWLRESAWFTVGLAIDALAASEVSWKKDAVDYVIKQLFTVATMWSPEKIALSLKLQELYPERDWQKIFSPVFKNPNLLGSSNLQTVSRIMKESTIDEEGHKDPTKAPSGTWKPQLHFAWDVILDQLVPGPNSTKKQATGSLQEFFKVVVDDSLFSANSSPQRKYWGFQVFQKALKRVTDEDMPMLFTKNFMRSWINHLSNRDRYLHKIAQQTVTEVQAFVKDKPQSGFAIILQLTGANGSKQFDKLTKTKTVESILASMKLEGIQSYVNYLFEQFNEFDESNQDEVDSRRTWIVDQLTALIRNGGIPKSDECIQSVMEWLTVYGLFVVKKKSSKSSITVLRQAPNPPVSEEVREVCKNRLLTCLGELSGLSAVIKSDEKTTKASAIASDGELWVAKVVSTIRTLEEDSKHVTLAAELEDEEKELLTKANAQVEQLKKVSEDQTEPARGAQLLVLSLILLQYCGEEQDADAFESCLEAVSRMPFWPSKSKKSKKKADKKGKDKEEGEDEEVEPIDVLTDVIIGFLEASTSYMRTIANQAFGYLSALVKESTVDLLVAQLERRSPAELAENDHEEDDEDVDMEDGDDDEAEGEEEDEKDEEEDGDSSGSESFGDIDLGDDDEDEEIDLELRKKIEEAIRVAGVKPATEDSDEEDDDEDLMDDDQMMAIDSQLAKVFGARANEKKGKNANAQREATHFKNRVLDLVEIFMKKHPTNAQIPRFIIPLVEVVAGSGQDEMQLRDKAKGILRGRISKAKEHPSEVNVEEAAEILEALHVQAKKAHGSDIMEILGTSSVYLVKLLVQAGKESTVEEAYRKSLEDFLTRKNSTFNAAFFKFFFQRQPAQAWRLRRSLLDLAAQAVNSYRQAQALQLLELLITQLPSMDDQAKAVADFMPALRESLVDLATKACADQSKLTAPQMKELLKLALLSARQTKRFAEASLTDIWKPESWSALKQTLAKSSRFASSTGLHKMCDQMVQLTGGKEKTEASGKKSPAKRKRKAEEVEEDAEPAPKVKKTKVKAKKVKAPSS
ncbi:DNA-directed DNA polymerase [Ephemerocybe angulata]|uniref:DNA-directed DNA polymerase n=1 Tax=Ephemerocybe angulata TaxID=980116 RepID=A0A8H6MH69_9AGAR|nr:DNA-directed DNA polymerase [Tulosesus angulatus]